MAMLYQFEYNICIPEDTWQVSQAGLNPGLDR